MITYVFVGEHKPRQGDVMISFLPLAHMLERACENALFYAGGAIGYYSGDIKELTNDLKALKPTIMPAVPRLLNRVYDKINNEISNSPIKKMLFRMALNSKEAEIRRGIIRKNSLWDKLVFKKVQDAFGGRLRLMVSKMKLKRLRKYLYESKTLCRWLDQHHWLAQF